MNLLVTPVTIRYPPPSNYLFCDVKTSATNIPPATIRLNTVCVLKSCFEYLPFLYYVMKFDNEVKL